MNKSRIGDRIPRQPESSKLGTPTDALEQVVRNPCLLEVQGRESERTHLVYESWRKPGSGRFRSRGGRLRRDGLPGTFRRAAILLCQGAVIVRLELLPDEVTCAAPVSIVEYVPAELSSDLASYPTFL